VIDYKTVSTAEELVGKLTECAPDGIDMYFENVGGMHFEAAMTALRPHGRVAVCGGIARYNEGAHVAVSSAETSSASPLYS
jgi:NADPH-dependent curcumin reductase CurA